VRRSSSAGLALGLVGVALVAGRNWAQNNDLNVQFHAFEDARAVTVLSPTVELTQDFTDRTTLRLKYGLDAISAASDSCVRCHRDGVNTHRQSFDLSATRKYGDVKLTFGGSYDLENFYRATTGLMSVSRDLAKGNATVAGGFSFSLNQPTLHPEPVTANQYQMGGFVSLTQTLSKTTIVQGGYEVGRLSGYLTNPFLRATVNGALLLGQVPDERLRHTISVRLRQALPADTFLEADYRRYVDDWQVKSNMVNLGVSHRFGAGLLLNAAYRRYDQTGAFFWAPFYVGTPQYYTADFRLEPFNSNDYIGHVEVTPRGQLWWFPTGTSVMVQYERYQADNGFQAAIVSTGVRVPLKLRHP